MNCTIRKKDSERNQNNHYQEGLAQFAKSFGLKDEYIVKEGEIDPPQYSRIVQDSNGQNGSKTRIDMILSNIPKCTEIKYQETGMQKMDHRMVIANYDINVMKKTKPKWEAKKNRGWIFPKELEKDELMQEGVKIIAKNQEGENE